MKKLTLVSLLLIIVASIILVGACAGSKPMASDDNSGETRPVKQLEGVGTKPGQTAPPFELASVKGEKVSMESLQGSPAVLVFWSYYCPSCEEEAPHINKLQSEFGNQGVQVVGINIGESEARTMNGIKDWGIKYQVARDEGSKVTTRFGVIGTPTIIILDKNGKVKYNGNKLPEDYPKILDKIV